MKKKVIQLIRYMYIICIICNTLILHFAIITQSITSQADNLIYADLGPSAFKQRSLISVTPDDDFVEYARLNHELKDKSETILSIQLQSKNYSVGKN